MSIPSDFHLHSSFSGDSDTSMDLMVRSGIAKGLQSMCFTEHNDFDFPDIPESGINSSTFLLNVDSYLYDILRMREKYADKIQILFGIEIGLQDSCLDKNTELINAYDFDFVIASSHLCMGADPYYPSFFENHKASDGYRAYFEEMLSYVRNYKDYDVYGHLDYIARYAPADADRSFSYFDYSDLIDEILKAIISNHKGIECNTSGLRKPLNATNPSVDILKRYKELGGEIITVGSDAHFAEHVAADFDKAADILKACGFRYYNTFVHRQPVFDKL